MELSVDGLRLYGTFLDYALIDQAQRPMQVSTLNSGSILSFVLPHFWVHAVIDPGTLLIYFNNIMYGIINSNLRFLCTFGWTFYRKRRMWI